MKVQRPTPSRGGGSRITVTYRTPEPRRADPVEPEVRGTKTLSRSEDLGLTRYCRCGAVATVVDTSRYPHRYSCIEHIGRKSSERKSQLDQLMELIQKGESH